MKKIILSSTLVSLFLIASAFMAPPAQVIDYQYVDNGSFTYASPCNGENINFTYTGIQNFHVVFNNNKINVSVQGHYKYDGTGDQGNSYHGVDNFHDNYTIPLVNGAYTETYVENVTIVGQGGAPNFLIRTRFKVTVTPNGTVSVFRDNSTFECKG